MIGGPSKGWDTWQVELTPKSDIATRRNRFNVSERALLILSGILFKLALDASYLIYLSTAFNDHFLTPFVINLSVLQLLESYLWATSVPLYMPTSSQSAVGLAILCAYIFLFAPACTIYGMDSTKSRETLFLASIAIVSTYLVSSVKIGRRMRIPMPIRGDRTLLSLSFWFVFMFLAVTIYSGAILKMNFNLDLIYEFRSIRASEIDFELLAYTNLWAQKIFTPLILAIGLERKSAWMIGFAIAMHFVFFGVTQHRSHLFTPLLVLIAFQIYHREISYAGILAVVSVALLIFLATNTLLDLKDLAAIAVRRALFVGASVTYAWVDFFSTNAKVHFADNLLSKQVLNTYSGLNLPKYMGEYMRPNAQLAFNSGLVGSGYAHLGAAGAGLYGAILGLIVRFNGRLIQLGAPPYIHAAIFFLPYRIAWADADLTTGLLSHGLILGSLTLWLYGCSICEQRPK